MKIRSRVILSIIILCVITFVIAVALYMTLLRINDLNAREDTAERLLLKSHELSELSNDYILFHEKRQQVQWETKYNSITSTLAQLRVDRPDEQNLVDNFASNHKRLKEIFNEVRGFFETDSDSIKDGGDIGFLRLSWARLAVRAQGMIHDVSQLSQLIQTETRNVHHRITVLIMTMIGTLIVFIVVNYFFINWKLLRSVANLRKGATVIGEGNLDYRIDDTAKDEIGDLARSFNQMSVNLINVMASKEELNREVEERKRAEEAIRESEEHFKLLAENAPVAIFVQTQLQFAYLNPEALNLFGAKTEDQLLGQPVIDRFDPSYHDIVKERIHLLNEEKKQVGMMDQVYLKLDGSPFDAAVSAAPIRWRGHDGAIVFFRDVTERKRVQEELLQSELRLSRAELVAGLGNWEIDLSTKKATASVGARKIYGVGQQEFTLDDVKKFPLPEYRSMLHEALLALIKDGAPYDIEFKIKRPNDDQVFDIHSIAHHDPEKNSLFGIIHDITDLRHAEESYRLLFAAIAQAAEGVIITDTTGIIQYANPAEESITGYSNDELLGRKPSIFKSDGHDENFYRNLWETINSGKVWSGRFINKKKDGTEYHEDASISPVYDKSGNLRNFVAVKHDVTKQLGLQEQLLQAQKMEAMGTLAGGFAHDFNNKLQVINGYVDLILFNKDLPETVKSELGVIKQTVDSSAELIRGMMVFSRKTPIELQPIELNKLVAQTRSMLTRSVPKMIEIDLLLADDLWAINASPNQIDQILMNLAVNARDAMPDGGRLTLKTENITLDDEYCIFDPMAKPGRYALITVSDTGCGMDKETVSHIFEPFFTTKASGKGTGLGLAVVYGIVELHGGRIICDSEPSVGTTFRIYFPAIEEILQEQYSEKREPPRGHGEIILLVDDEPDFLETTSRLLADANYMVITALNGENALELYEKHREEIKLVVLDFIMPGLGGKRCLEALRNMDPNSRALIVSGFQKEGMTQELKDAGASDFILKPFDTPQLLEKIRKIIDEE